jgi:tRNA (cytidine/uridine-2'-O-)-methyltransferase
VFHVILYEPEIPPNTGNIMRLCANTGCALHLVGPLGFALEDAKLRRAGLDYREWARVEVHAGLESCLATLRPGAVYAYSTRGSRLYTEPAYRPGDALVFGPETRGLPAEVLAALAPERVVHLPMALGNRSLNLSNAVAVAVYEAWRQNGFAAR